MKRPLFQPYEPRAIFPVFSDCENRLNYILRETYIPGPRAVLRHVAGRILKRDHAAHPRFLARLMMDSLRGIRLGFRGAFLRRDGRLIAEIPRFASVGYRQGFDISIDRLLAASGLAKQDGQFLLIADRGVKLDGGYGIGTIGAVYRNKHTFTCYRNGAFARPINEASHHRPSGFRSIAPHMTYTDGLESSAYFFNFSSDANYKRGAAPGVRLYRRREEYLEGTFGLIPPFGAAERSLSEMFGTQAREFLADTGGVGTLIAEAEGVTLGSVHLIRNRTAGTMGIEHTRPTHLYVA
jgi:hypothetical protein